jgi:hypothetical protein
MDFTRPKFFIIFLLNLNFIFFQVIAQSADRFSIADLEQCYALTFYSYGVNVRRHPNEHWAEDFYQQLVTVGELNRAHRM